MIFAAVGTQIPFDRLIKALDDWAVVNPDVPVVAQIGDGQYQPVALEAYPYLEPAQFTDLQKKADIILSHAGMGAILTAGMLAKPLVIVPRKHALGEHRNDHQMATASQFEQRPGIHIVWDEALLGGVLDKRHQLTSAPELSSYASSELLAAIDDFICERGTGAR
jgi:exopolysaccharide biosynthesis glucuronosyltransferase PssE